MAPPHSLVSLEGVSVTHGTRTVLDGVSLGVQRQDRIGVLGLNGSGKTTLLSVLAGTMPPDQGRVATGRDTRIAMVSQASALRRGSTVRDAVLHTFGDADHVWASDSAVRTVLSGLGLAEIGLDAGVDGLSGGEQRRVALAAALVTDATLLLLDEPTNHLDIEAVVWLAEYLRDRPGAVVTVTHDRWFLDALATTTWEVVDGAVHIRDGGYSDWIFARAERLRLDRAAEDRRSNLARKELAWLRRGPPARTAKPRYRIEAAEALIADVPAARNTVQLHSFAQRRLGKDVLELLDVNVVVPGPDGPRALLADLTWRIGPGDRIGVIGANGSGKSTLLRVLAGRTPAAGGRVRTGQTVRIGYLSQEVVELPAGKRLLEAVTDVAGSVSLGGRDVSASALAERFGFPPAQQWTPVERLSGGERRRLQLLRILMTEPNVLLLDEPTNDLDIDTLAALEDLLDGWPGTLLVVSHDRYFVERVTDDVHALLGDRGVTHLPAGIDDYLARRRRVLADLPPELAMASGLRDAGAPPVEAPGSRMSVTGIAAAGTQSPPTFAPGTAADPTQLRVLRKDLQRLERRLATLQRNESVLHERLADAGADYALAARLGDELRGVQREIATGEEQWLATAERLEA